MKVRIFVRHPLPLHLSPDHEGVHRTPDPLLLTPLSLPGQHAHPAAVVAPRPAPRHTPVLLGVGGVLGGVLSPVLSGTKRRASMNIFEKLLRKSVSKSRAIYELCMLLMVVQVLCKFFQNFLFANR